MFTNQHSSHQSRFLFGIALKILAGLLFGIACDDQESTSDLRDEQGVTQLAVGSSGLSEEELLDPYSCKACHPTHYDEWSRSVHAHASTSPIFRALNQLGQHETAGSLGDFCVQCHAPVATALGETQDGLNLAELPARSQGVTCAYCHQISEVRGTHNNQLTWTRDGIMRGRLSRPTPSSAHRSRYSPLHDGREHDSSALCGSCHDIVTPTGIHLEQTYLEWSQSIFADHDRGRANSCIDCHMPSRSSTGIAYGLTPSPEGLRHHDHLSPAVDLVISSSHSQLLRELRERTPKVEGVELSEAVNRELGFSLLSEVCAEVGVSGGADVEIYLENVSAGHRFPSGAALDRRLWVELQAVDAEGETLFVSGEVPHSTPVSDLARQDESLWLMRDRAFNRENVETHRFWEIYDVERTTLPAPTLIGRRGDEEPHVLKRYRFSTTRPIRELHLTVYLRPIGLELLQELNALGLLENEIIEQMPTHLLSSASQIWKVENSEARTTLSGRVLLCSPF